MTYNFYTKPYAHQVTAFERSKDETVFALFMEMGTGKSKVIIDTIDYLYRNGEINLALIFGNKGSYKNWINQEVPTHLSPDVPVMITHWDAAERKNLELEHELVMQPMHSLKIVVVNIESLAYEEPVLFCLKLLKKSKALMVVDESTTIKNEKAKRTKMALHLGKFAKYRRILTGSPVTNSPIDMYSQAKFLDPGLLRCSSFFAFKTRYTNTKDVVMGPRVFKQVTGYKNLDELARLIEPWSYRVTKDECLDLPEKVYNKLHISLSDEQRTAYKELSKDLVTYLTSGQLVSTELAITKILRLHQVTCGHVRDDEGNVHQFAHNRISALMSLLEETTGKVVIWAKYIQDIHNILDALKKEYPGLAVAYYGSVSQQDRETAITSFMTGSARFFVSNPQTGGYGITLTSASTVIYYSNSIKLDERLQSEDRTHRIGQNKSVTYYDIVAEKTIDEKIINALRQKRIVAQEILGDDITNWI